MIAPRVEVGRSLEFVASHVRVDADKLKIWAQVNPEGVHLIEASVARLQPELESDSGFLHHCQLHVGQIYCVRWGTPQSKWYRIRILAWPPNCPTTVAVHFIDYGWTDIVSVSNVRHCGELAHFPPQALEFIIADVIPPGNAGVWPEQIASFFDQHLLYKKVVGQIVGAVDGQAILRIFRSGERVPFSDILVKHGLAFSSRLVPPNSGNEMSHYRGETFHALPLDLVKEHLVYVAHIESPQKFFVQLGEKEQEINIMMEAIHIYAQQGTLQPLTTILPGTPCLAQFSGDGAYYRGIVTHVSGTNCQVVYVDYGNSEIKPCNELKVIPTEFLSLPLQAYQCSLVGAKSTDGRDLHVQTEGKLLSCHVLDQQGPTYVVSLKHQGKAITDYLAPSTPPPPSEALKTFTYRHFPLENEKYELSISYSYSPLEFYAQLSSNAHLLDRIMSQLKTCEKSNAKLSFGDCRPRLPVCAKFSEDEQWYRAEILSMAKSQIIVRFIDFGNSETTSIESLKPAIPDLVQIPVQAIRMGMDGLQNVEKETIESEVVVKKFEALTLEKELLAVVKGCNQIDGTYYVELYDTGPSPPKLLNVELENFIKYNYIPKLVQIHPPPLENLESIIITSFTSQFEFFGQLAKYPTEHLEALQVRLNEMYRSSKGSSQENIQIGQFVCAQFSDDRLFYRAKVMATRSTEAEVFFVDFGNKEIVGMDRIHVLHPNFASLPQQGIICSLLGAPPTINMNDLEAVMMDKIIEVRIMRQIGEKWEVQLTENPSNADVLKVLHSKKIHAKETVGSSRDIAFSTGSNNYDNWNGSGPRKRAEQNWGNKQDHHAKTSDTFHSPPFRGSHSRGTDDEKISSAEKSQRKPPRHHNEERPRRNLKYPSSGSSSHEESDWEPPGSSKGGHGRPSHQTRHSDSRKKDAHAGSSDSESRMGKSRVGARAEKLTNYLPNSLPEHACREVVISYIISPSEFYCQLTETSTQLDQIMENVALVYRPMHSTELEIRNPRIGMPCCAIYSEDGEWYRGRVLHLGGPRVEVEFVDYGNKELTTLSKIKELKPEFLTLPPQAYKCCLKDVQPTGEDWPVDVVEKFKETLADKTFLAQFVKLKSEGWYEVNLMEVDKLTNNILNKEFVSLELTKIPEWTPLEVAESLTFTEPVIGNGDREDVIVTWIKSPCEFYCQLASTQDTFRTMMLNMQERYSFIPPNEGLITTPTINMPCVAQFSEDDAWYRAQLVEVKGDKFVVFYVDYGNMDCLPPQSVRHIETQFIQLPLQAIRCQLKGVKPVPNDEWCTAKRSIIEKYYEESIVCTFVANYDSIFLVDLEKDGKSVADELVNAGLTIVDSKPCSVTSGDSLLGSEKPAIPKLRLDVKPGDSIDVLVSFAESPRLFWCQLQSNSEEVENLVVTLTNYYSQLGDNAQNVVNPSVGTSCAAKFSEDARWYRASVLDRPGPGRLKVLFIDYGNEEVVHHTQCKVLLPEYLQLPSQAIRCTLPDLPVDIPDDLAKDFVNMVDGEEFAGRVEEVHENAVVLSLFTTTEGQEVNVAQTIFGSVLLGQQSAPNPTLETIAKQTVPDEEHAITVTYVDSVSRFFLRLVAAEKDRQEMNEKLLDLEGGDASVKLDVGTVCCTKHPESSTWIRVLITFIDEESVTVEALDSGEALVIPKECLKQIPEDCLKYPPFAYECKLDGVLPVNNNWLFEDNELFKVLVKKEPLIASFVSTTRPFAVCLQNEDGDISEILVNSGNAKALEVQSQIAYESRTLSEGEVTVSIPVVVSLSEFYITPVSLMDELQALSDRMQEVYEGKEMESIDKVVVGMPCAAKYSVDGTWYRACIMSDDDLVTVKFVDYGNTEVTAATNLKMLQDEFLEAAPFAVECSLSGIQPKENMEIESIIRFEQLVLDQEVVLNVISSKLPYQVQMSLDGKNIVEELLATGAVVKIPSIDDTNICTIASPIPALRYRKCDFGLGQKKQAVVSHSNHPSEFWVQLVDGQICLEDLMQELAERYGGETDEDEVTDVFPGLPCVAHFSDGAWYRAEVLDVMENIVKVNYVDYGNEDIIPTSMLKTIEPDLVVLPVQAIKCFMADIEPCEEEGWSLQAIEEFHEEIGVAEKVLLVECITEEADSFGVVLKDMGMSVGKKLVAKGVATSRESFSDLTSMLTASKGKSASHTDDQCVARNSVCTSIHDNKIVPGVVSFIDDDVVKETETIEELEYLQEYESSIENSVVNLQEETFKEETNKTVIEKMPEKESSLLDVTESEMIADKEVSDSEKESLSIDSKNVGVVDETQDKVKNGSVESVNDSYALSEIQDTLDYDADNVEPKMETDEALMSEASNDSCALSETQDTLNSSTDDTELLQKTEANEVPMCESSKDSCTLSEMLNSNQNVQVNVDTVMPNLEVKKDVDCSKVDVDETVPLHSENKAAKQEVVMETETVLETQSVIVASSKEGEQIRPELTQGGLTLTEHEEQNSDVDKFVTELPATDKVANLDEVQATIESKHGVKVCENSEASDAAGVEDDLEKCFKRFELNEAGIASVANKPKTETNLEEGVPEKCESPADASDASDAPTVETLPQSEHHKNTTLSIVESNEESLLTNLAAPKSSETECKSFPSDEAQS